MTGIDEFNAEVPASERQRNIDHAAAASLSGDAIRLACRAADRAHFERVLAAADRHGINSPNARAALADLP